MTEKRIKLSFIGITLGMISSVLMQTIIATILPTISNDLGNKDLYGWVFSSYMIASTITIPLFANLSDVYGRKKFYLLGMLLFLTGSLLSGFAQSMNQLIIFRIIQGIGAGAIAPSAIAMISELFTSEKRVKMLGLLSAFQVFANILGPLLGGFIADIYSWRWAFFINIPIGILAFLLIKYNFYDNSKKEKEETKKIDYIGSIELGVFLVSLILFLQLLENGLHLKDILVLGLSLLAFFGFLVQERKHPNPIISLELIKVKNIKISLISMLFLGIILYGMIAIVPLYGQMLISNEALKGGKLLLFLSLGVGLGGILSGRLSSYVSFTKLVSISWLISSIGLLLLILGNIYFINSFWHISFILAVGVGIGINLPLLYAFSQNAVADNKQGVIGGLVQITKNLGGAISIPILTKVIVSSEQHLISINSFTLTFSILLVIALLGLIVGLRFKEDKI